MKVETFKCDLCGIMKGENNHWFRVDTGASGLELNAWGVMAQTDTSMDLCSDQCVITVVQKWLTLQARSSGARYGIHSADMFSMNGQRAM